MKKIFCFIIIILVCNNSFAIQISNESKFLNFSDVHFDPFYDSTLVEKLIRSEYTEWERIFSGSEIKSLSKYGSDSNFPLFKSAMEEMSSRIPDPDFIIITGDFMEHNFNEDYEHYSGIKNTDSLNLFIKNTIQFITSFIVKYYPNTVIYPMVGNDDSYCGNYMIAPESDFLKMLSDVWEPLVNKNENNKFFGSDFSKGGYCMLNFPGEENNKIIIMNTVFFATNYQNLCGDTLLDPGADELAWLKNTLEQCRVGNYKVWLSYHIPPGIDIYGTINGKGNCEEKIFPTWKEKYNNEFLKIIKEYSEIILSNFAGHFHRDDFRVIYNRNVPVSYIHITPSISPVYGNNPAYQIIEYDKSNYQLTNYQTYYLKNLAESDSAYWTFEYDFKNSFGQSLISPSSLNNISNLIFEDSTYRKKYIRYYTSERTKTFESDYSNWFYNWCAIRHLTEAEYAGCMCADSLKIKK